MKAKSWKKEIKDIEILFELERPSLLANIRRFCLCRCFSLKPFKIYSFFFINSFSSSVLYFRAPDWYYLRSMGMWKNNFEVDSQVFINLHKYAFMYCFFVGNSPPAVHKQYHQTDIIFLFLQERPQKEENESLCVQFTSEYAGLCLWLFRPPVHSHIHTLALSAACRRGDESWLLIVMVFAPLIYPAHAGYLARPDCVDGDTSILSLGGEARRWSVRNEGDVINQRRAHRRKAVSHLPEMVPLLMEITQWRLFFFFFLSLFVSRQYRNWKFIFFSLSLPLTTKVTLR